MGACTQSRNFFIVSEYLPGGDVEKLLHDPKVELSLYQRMTMAKDAALGMNWLHCSNPNVIHRDLKTSNLLIDENGRVKVCDFGLSQLKTPGEDLKDGDSAKGTVRRGSARERCFDGAYRFFLFLRALMRLVSLTH